MSKTNHFPMHVLISVNSEIIKAIFYTINIVQMFIYFTVVLF